MCLSRSKSQGEVNINLLFHRLQWLWAADKMHELWVLVRHQKEYWHCSVLWIMKTWLHLSDTVPSFMTVQAGEDSKLNGKKKSGRIAVFVNERWCYPRHATMKGCLCSPDWAFSCRYASILFITRILLCHTIISSWGRGMWHHTFDCSWPIAYKTFIIFNVFLTILMWNPLWQILSCM